MAVGAEKVKDSGYAGLNAYPIPSDGTGRTLTAAAMARAQAQKVATHPETALAMLSDPDGSLWLGNPDSRRDGLTFIGANSRRTRFRAACGDWRTGCSGAHL